MGRLCAALGDRRKDVSRKRGAVKPPHAARMVKPREVTGSVRSPSPWGEGRGEWGLPAALTGNLYLTKYHFSVWKMWKVEFIITANL